MTDEIAPTGRSPGKLSFFRRAAGTGLAALAASALAWWQWDRIVAHPWISGAVAAGAALLAAVGGLGKKVWAELEGKWAKSVAEWIDAQSRRAVVEWVGRQVERYGKARFIVTSQPHGYKTNPLPEATVLEVQPFTLKQVERFVHGWYLANEVLSFGQDDPGVRQKAEAQGRDLLQRLRNAPTLAALSVNPLLLTMIAMVHRYRGALPGRRVELYDEICNVLLGHWQAAKGLSAELTAAQQRLVLQPLAFHLMAAEAREISATEAAEIVSGPLSGVVTGETDAGAFLEGVQAGSGLLVEWESGVYSFAHLTFQEYLAAAHLIAEQSPEELVSRIGDPWWHNPV